MCNPSFNGPLAEWKLRELAEDQKRFGAQQGEEGMTDDPDPFEPDPFETAVVGIIRLLAPWPPEQRVKILKGADYCMHCGQELSKHGFNFNAACSEPKPGDDDFDAH